MFIYSCSVACGKKHKETPCEPYVEKPPPSARGQHGHKNQKKAVHPASARRFENDVDPRYDLSAEQYGLLDANQKLQAQLRDPRLMETLRGIHGAGDKRATLDAEMQNPEFLAFCDEILDCVGYTSE